MGTPRKIPILTSAIRATEPAIQHRLELAQFETIEVLAEAENINSSYVFRLLRLTLLALEIVEAILDSRRPERISLPGLMKPLPTV